MRIDLRLPTESVKRVSAIQARMGDGATVQDVFKDALRLYEWALDHENDLCDREGKPLRLFVRSHAKGEEGS
jgi:hypothetical protein